MKFYRPDGYADMKGILETGIPFIFVVGARGVGKSYGTLDSNVETGTTFLLLRRTQAQADLISNPDFNVFKPLNEDKGYNIIPHRVSKYNSAFVWDDKIICYSAALSTLSNMRGFDSSEIEQIMYDEFIPEEHERPIKNEAKALLNAYETINRNRELKGRKPVQLICLANSNDIANPVFEYLGLIKIADKMQKTNNDVWIDKERGFMIVMMHRSPISKAKRDTALYRLTKGTDFSSMALENDFNVSRTNIKPRPLQEYTPVCIVGEMCVYRHKSESRLYITTHAAGVFRDIFKPEDIQIEHYQNQYYSHYDMYIEGKIDFEDVLAEKLFRKYWND